MDRLEALKAALNQQEFKQVIQMAEQFISKNPQDLEAIYYRAISLRKLNRVREALNDFDTIVNLLPTDAHILGERAVTHFHLKEHDLALEDLDKAVALEPENPFRYSSRAYVKASLKDLEGAQADYKKAIELDPEDAIAHNNLGLVEEQMGRKDAAKSHFDRADKISETNEDFKGMYGGHTKQGRIEKSEPEEKPKVTNLNEASKSDSSPKKMTAKHFFQTLTGVIGSKEERQAFVDFFAKRNKRS